MSINQHLSCSSSSSEVVPQGQYWWSHYAMDSPPPPTASPSSSFWLTPLHLYPTSAASPQRNAFDLNLDDEQQLIHENPTESEIPQERLFEKPLTPSDVGKLNRLVIPKQHAEKHFPLNGGANSADSGAENGLLLGFEDELGKSWRFRYSYWNSSQSYVLTKGWSRFVKDKRLHAGDIVVFSRHRIDTARLFIAWRRRSLHESHPPSTIYNCQQPPISVSNSNSLSYQPHTQTLHAPPAGSGSGVASSSSASHGNNNNSSSKRQQLRLFGVNLECHATEDDSEPSTPVGSPISNHQYQQYYSSNHHMDMSFSGAAADVYRQG